MMIFSQLSFLQSRAVRLSGLLVFLLIVPQSFQVLSSRAQETIPAEPAMWKVESGDSTVYLLGTFHLLTPDIKWQSARIMEAFDQSDSLTVEVTDEDLAPQKMMALIQKMGMYPPTDSLKNHISAEIFTDLSEQGAAVGLPAQLLERFKPWFAAVTLAAQYTQVQGFSPELGVDFTLMARARDTGKNIVGLETAEEQIAKFSDQPDAFQKLMLEDTLRELSEFDTVLTDMTRAWATGDSEDLEKFMLEGMRGVPELYDVLLVDRNRNWVPRMKELLATPGQHFVAVGAAHLVGGDSVVAMLRKEGYQVERVLE